MEQMSRIEQLLRQLSSEFRVDLPSRLYEFLSGRRCNSLEQFRQLSEFHFVPHLNGDERALKFLLYVQKGLPHLTYACPLPPLSASTLLMLIGIANRLNNLSAFPT